MQSEASNSYLGLDPLFSALEVSSDSVEIDDIEGSIVFVNDAWCRLSDMGKQDAVGARYDALRLSDADNAGLYTSLARCVAYGHSEGAFRLSVCVTYLHRMHQRRSNVVIQAALVELAPH